MKPTSEDSPEIQPMASSTQTAEKQLEDRIGRFHYIQRVRRERETSRDPYRRREIEEFLPVAALLKAGLKLLGLWQRGVSNADKFETTDNIVLIKDLPEAFVGFRILHLSDFHFRSDIGVSPGLLALLKSSTYDICVMTGDYSPGFSDRACLRTMMAEVMDTITVETFAVLGNHDSITMVPWMEKLGIRLLLNESFDLKSGCQTIKIVGVDDYHRFRLSNLEKALKDTDGAVTILLAHTPEQYRQAAYGDVDLYLAGHTHGGQVCLPNGFAPKMNINCHHGVGKGCWQFNQMQGYTSRGVGTSLVHVRFNCPPEVVIHELHRG